MANDADDASGAAIPRSRLLLQLLGAALVAGLVLLLFALPAEYGIDPTGFGRWSGLTRLHASAAPAAVSGAADSSANARFEDKGYHQTTIDIDLASGETREGSELEYKVLMQRGATLVYAWNVSGDEPHPDWFYYDFHSEAWPAPPGKEPQVVEHRQATGISSQGVFTAPFDGVHGWYLQNQSDKPVTVHLRLAGFYQLVPPGNYGNEAGIAPKSSE